MSSIAEARALARQSGAKRNRGRTPATVVTDPQYFHKVVDCQYACPTHTPVPEYIRLIAQGRYAAAYMLNWESNVFPGILGRVCDRPCEPACRRGRVQTGDEANAKDPSRKDAEPVAICRLKRVAADLKGEIDVFMPEIPVEKNGKRIALLGAGPASLTIARDLLPLGYSVTLFEKDARGGGLMRTTSRRSGCRKQYSTRKLSASSSSASKPASGTKSKACVRSSPKATTPCSSAPARRRART